MRGPTPVADILKDMHRGAFQDQQQGGGGLGIGDDADDLFSDLVGEATVQQPEVPAPKPRGRRAAGAGRKTLTVV
jgi:hypothetical protein